MNMASFRYQVLLYLRLLNLISVTADIRICTARSISNFVTMFHQKQLPLHLLANNAAVWMVEDQMTEDGFEVKGCGVFVLQC